MVGGRNWAVCQSKDVLATKRGMGEASSTKVQVAGLKTIGLYDSMLCVCVSFFLGRQVIEVAAQVPMFGRYLLLEISHASCVIFPICFHSHQE